MMRKLLLAFIVFLILLNTLKTFSQNPISYLKEVIRLSDTISNPKEKQGFLWNSFYLLGSEYLNARELDSAIYYTKKAIELDSTILQSYLQLGDIQFEQEKYPEAYQNFKKVEEFDSSSLEIPLRLIKCALNLRDYNQANSLILRKQYQDSAEFTNDPSIRISFLKSVFDEAVTIHQSNPTEYYLLYELGFISYQAKIYKFTIHYLQEYINAEIPSKIVSDSYVILSNCYLKEGKKAKSRHYLRKFKVSDKQ